MNTAESEQYKYEKAWEHGAYRNYSPGESIVQYYINRCSPRPGRLIDFGAGTGRAALELHKRGYDVSMVDIATNCLDHQVRSEIGDRLVVGNLWGKLDLPKAPEGFCTDVMEHIPPERVDAVIDNIIGLCDRVFFQICLVDDRFGDEIGEHLHLTVQPYEWWLEKLSGYGTVIGSGQMNHAIAWFYVSREKPGTMADFKYGLDKDGKLLSFDEVTLKINAEEEERLENVKSCLERGLPEIMSYDVQDTVVAIAGGGPSLDDTFDELKQLYDDGVPVVSLNGSHDYLIERGIKPRLHMQLDARQFNKRFVENWQEGIKYFIASQSHPDVFDTLDGADVTVFHCVSSDKELEHLESLGRSVGFVGGGSTIMLRALILMRTLGFHKMEIFGFDSCCMNDEHHAYAQDENHNGSVTVVKVGGRDFFCYGWMHEQAKGFVKTVKTYGNMFDLNIHGDGLIAHIIKTAAEKQEEIGNGSTSMEVL
jgi:hypothetical protein